MLPLFFSGLLSYLVRMKRSVSRARESTLTVFVILQKKKKKSIMPFIGVFSCYVFFFFFFFLEENYIAFLC